MPERQARACLPRYDCVMQAAAAQSIDQQPRVVILGAGFGGLACARELGGAPARVTIVDRRNYHLFVPLLYQVATAALSPADIARPIRRILGRYSNIEVVLGEVTGLDRAARIVRLQDGAEIAYDRLVIATGSHYSYFGHPEWAACAPGPRTLEDARRIRARLLTSFERAEAALDPAMQDALMTIVIVGGGPTGVEMAGAVAELTRHALARDFHRIDPRRARIVLVEAGPRLLAGFPAVAVGLCARRAGTPWRDGHHQRSRRSIDERGVTVAGRRIDAGTVIWGAGIEASPAGQWLGVALDRAGRIAVNPDLSVRGLDDVYALGDSALANGEDGTTLPALAQVAAQQGEHLGRALARNLRSGVPLPAFRFQQPRQHGHHRPARRGVRFRLDAAQGTRSRGCCGRSSTSTCWSASTTACASRCSGSGPTSPTSAARA